MRILIAEDDPANRRLLQVTLTRWGYDVVIACDGVEAWEVLRHPDAPTLAVLDWIMPGMDGVDVCRRVRARTNGPYIFLLLLTSRDQKGDMIAGMEAGADDYLIKPFDPQELQVRLRAGQRIIDLQAQLLASLNEVQRAEEALSEAQEREGDIGARIQQTLLLGQPPRNLPGLRIAPLTIPSRRIDGDFYDFFAHGDHCLDIVVGDVMGKGVPAALLGAAIKSHLLRALSQLIITERGRLPEPEEILARVHEEVTTEFIRLESFVTLCYARLDRERRQLTFVDCGHAKTIHFQASRGACALLQGENMPLGFSPGEIYRQASVPLADGDLLFFYSDGVTEAQNETGELFGVPRLSELIRANSYLSPEALIETVRAAVVAYSHSETFADDLTCVAVRIGPHPPHSVRPSASPDHPAAPAGEGPGERAALTLRSDLSELPSLRAFVRRFCQSALDPPLDEVAIGQLELAVTEAASNIVKHAYQGRADEVIQVEVEALESGGGVSLRLHHHGEAFDPDAAPPPAFDGSREGGFGVYFIVQSVDEVRYFREADGRNGILLIKKGNQEADGTDG